MGSNPEKTLDVERVWSPRSPAVRLAYAALPALLAVVACRQNLSFGLLGDAEFLVRDNAFLREWKYLLPQFTHEHFWSSSGAAPIGYFRPITKASWLVETMLSGGASWVYHAVQLALFVLAVTGVQRLARGANVRPLPATLSACLLAIHPGTVEPVSLVMARSDVAALAGVVWALYAWQRWAAQRGNGGRWLALHLIAFALAVGSKEIAVVAILPLVLWAWNARPALGGRRLALAILPTVVMAIAFLAARRVVVGPSAAVAGGGGPLVWLVAGGMYIEGLFPFALDTGIRSLAYAEMHDAGRIGRALAVVLVFAFCAVPAVRARRMLSLGALLWIVASLAVVVVLRLPAAGINDKLPLADRWLLPAVAGLAIFVGSELDAIGRESVRIAGAAVLGLSCIANLAVSSAQRAPYRDALSLLAVEERQLESTPERYWTHDDRCRISERRLFRATAAGDAQAGLEAFEQSRRSECVPNEIQIVNVLSLFVQAQRWREAAGVVRLAQEHPPRGWGAGPYHHLAGLALLRIGRPAEAVPELEEALRRGVKDCTIHAAIAEAASALGDRAAALQGIESTRRCLAARHDAAK